MGGRAWSQEELIRLEELTEKYPLATVARKLNRSEMRSFLKGSGPVSEDSWRTQTC